MNKPFVIAITVFALVLRASADDKLAARYEKIAKQAQGRVGAASVLLEGGDNEVTCIRCDEHFPMQSVYKFPIAWAVLAQVDAGKLTLNQPVLVSKADYLPENFHSPIRDRSKGQEMTVPLKELVRLAVEQSDSTASDVLMRLLNNEAKATPNPHSVGVREIMRFLATVGVDGTSINIQDPEIAIARDTQLQYRNWMTPRGALKLLRAFHEGKGLSKESHALLQDMLEHSVRGERRLKGLLPKETVLAHKTGTGGTKNGVTTATNDIGILTLPNGKHLAVAVFVSDSKANEVTRERTIARMARAAWDDSGVGSSRKKISAALPKTNNRYR